MAAVNDPRIFDHYRRQKLWREPPEPPKEVIEILRREIAVDRAIEEIDKAKAETIRATKPMTVNTGARGFAAILKARASQMKEEFSRLANEMNDEFATMQDHLSNGKKQVAEMKADNKELKEAFGLDNESPTA